jgi:AcrR family transcriptional regulator
MNQKSSVKAKRAPMNRGATEAALEAAALRLLKRNGVLAGLNLREVAEEAGVNRGLVYHYYGSRQHLLRSALKKDTKKWLGKDISDPRLPFRNRIVQMFKSLSGHEVTIKLATLLTLDGVDGPRFSPLKKRRMADLQQDIDNGDISSETDIEALLVVIAAMGNGYMTSRRGLGKEFQIPLKELDERVYKVLGRMFSSFESTEGNED